MAAQNFVHPGILHTNDDFARIKAKIDAQEEPWLSAYNVFKADYASQKTYTLRGPAATVQRDKGAFANYTLFIRDASAAYNNAIMWKLTGDPAHAEKAIQIMNAWSYTLDTLYGSDMQLGAGQIGFRWVNAAEIIRSTYSGWAPADIQQFETMLKTKFVPWIDMYGDANWGGGCIKAMLGIGIFCNDTTIYNSAINAFNTHACTSLSKIIALSGQNTESGRDQIHAQVNIGHLAEVAWVGQNQGLDLFGALDNRILKGFEYQAKYMLGNNVPYDPGIYRCTMGPWSTITSVNRSLPELLPMYEMVYNYYVNRKGLEAPYTTMAAQHTRIETKAAVNYDGEHLIGWGTLMYSLDRGNRLDQNITSFPTIRKKMGDADFDPGAIASSGLPVLYSSSNPAVATIVNNKVHIVSAGVTVITAYQPGNNVYKPAEKVSQTLSLVFNPYVNLQAADFYTATGINTISAQDGSASTAIASQSNPSTLAYAGAQLGTKGASMMYFRYASNADTAVTVTIRLDRVNGPKMGSIQLPPTGGEQVWKTDSCALNGSTGTRDIWISLGGKVGLNWMRLDSLKTYNADPVASPVVKIEAEDYSEKGGNVDWGTPALGNIKSVGWTSYKNIDLNGLTRIEVYASSNSSAGSTISKNIEVRLDALNGPVIATLVVPKTNSWGVYTTVSVPISGVSGKHTLYFRYTVSGGSFTSYLYNIDWYQLYFNTQSITFPSMAHKETGDADFDPGAFASSGLPIGYSSSNAEVATIVDGKIHIVGAGTTIIKAVQNGNTAFSAATPVYQNLIVNKPYYVDADKDGFGSKDSMLFATEQTPEGYANNNSDCNDSKLLYVDLDGDGLGAGAPVACGVENNSDCDDTNPNQLTALIPDVYALNPEVDAKNTLYVGYGPSTIVLSAFPSGGTAPYTFEWNTAQATQEISINAKGSYSVNVTDTKGCTTTASITINTVDVSCGKNNDKVMICHNEKTICIASQDVQDHLSHGDHLGSCPTAAISMNVERSDVQMTNTKLVLYPNPVKEKLTIQVEKLHTGASVHIYNAYGLRIMSQLLTNTTQLLSLKTLAAGVYYVQVYNGIVLITRKVIKE